MKNIELKCLFVILGFIIGLQLVILNNQNKTIDTGLHEIQDCVMLNEEVYCRIAMVVEE